MISFSISAARLIRITLIPFFSFQLKGRVVLSRLLTQIYCRTHFAQSYTRKVIERNSIERQTFFFSFSHSVNWNLPDIQRKYFERGSAACHSSFILSTHPMFLTYLLPLRMYHWLFYIIGNPFPMLPCCSMSARVASIAIAF